MPSAITARLRPGVYASDAHDWRSQVLKHELTEPPPIADVQLTIVGRWTRRALMDAVGELADQLSRRGLLSEASIHETNQRKVA
jgi:hypothetical protein